jgi:spore photoproduct lyase
MINSLETVFIDKRSLESEVAQNAFKLFPREKIEIVEKEPWSEIKRTLTAEEFSRSKKNIFLTPFEGQFFKRCPGSSQKKVLNCCNYHILNLGSQCPMNCSYCYLQSYLNSPVSKIYTNIEQALAELKLMANQSSHHPFRVGTGEIIDSLAFDELTLYSRKLIHFFANYPKWTLEFKTKSNLVDQFLDLGPAKNTVVSWSLNADYVIKMEEHGTASLDQRLAAAQKCIQAGFAIAFHLDPLIYHQDWQKNYSDLVSRITSQFKPDQVNVISLGSLRFQPEQRLMMKKRFGLTSLVNQAEMFPSEGAKLRYDSGLRNEMFKFIYNHFKSHSETWRIFLCMETPETWISTFENQPLHRPELKDLFRPLPSLASN